MLQSVGVGEAAVVWRWMLDVRIFFSEPVGCGGLEEFGDGDALAADEEFGGWVVGFVEGGNAGEVVHG